ncbi:MAG: helix-turn-helix domain-containing protein [Burkholderiaceae bacterium]|jgi:transcriptional regulator with XRE-family HTH domain|nr:helix-turn-helix domain-containing protein [Burkholderiaceae bacterium]
MPARSPSASLAVVEAATRVGHQIRDRRKALGVTVTDAAESAGMSRVTWHRIERGQLSATFGAYLAALDVLDLSVSVGITGKAGDAIPEEQGKEFLPLQISLSEYSQLRRLAWQVTGVDELTPQEAWSFYQRNWRHVDTASLEPHERHLIEMLGKVFKGRDRV